MQSISIRDNKFHPASSYGQELFIDMKEANRQMQIQKLREERLSSLSTSRSIAAMGASLFIALSLFSIINKTYSDTNDSKTLNDTEVVWITTCVFGGLYMILKVLKFNAKMDKIKYKLDQI